MPVVKLDDNGIYIDSCGEKYRPTLSIDAMYLKDYLQNLAKQELGVSQFNKGDKVSVNHFQSFVIRAARVWTPGQRKNSAMWFPETPLTEEEILQRIEMYQNMLIRDNAEVRNQTGYHQAMTLKRIPRIVEHLKILAMELLKNSE